MADSQLAQDTAAMRWYPARDGYRPPVTVRVQLQGMIVLGLTSAHWPPMNNSHYDGVTGTWNLSWKWGTFSYWTYSEDVNILFIRYAQLCLNGDLEM
eukprot:16431204-Heterocapsa_arctica.AAC.1